MHNEVRNIREDNGIIVNFMAASVQSSSYDPSLPPTRGWYFTCGNRSNIDVQVELGVCRECGSDQVLGPHNSAIHNSFVCRGNCGPGFTMASNLVCTQFVAGKYKFLSGDMACTDCPSNSYSPVGSAACTCNSGMFQGDGSFIRLSGEICDVGIEDDFFRNQLVYDERPTYTADTIYGPRHIYFLPEWQLWSISPDMGTNVANTRRLRIQSTSLDVPRTVWEEWCDSSGWKTSGVTIEYKISCIPCPVNSYSIANSDVSTVMTKCSCNSGSSGKNGEAPCTLCGVGKYKQRRPECTAGSVWRQSEQKCVFCEAGYGSVEGIRDALGKSETSCDPCGAGTFTLFLTYKSTLDPVDYHLRCNDLCGGINGKGMHAEEHSNFCAVCNAGCQGSCPFHTAGDLLGQEDATNCTVCPANTIPQTTPQTAAQMREIRCVSSGN